MIGVRVLLPFVDEGKECVSTVKGALLMLIFLDDELVNRKTDFQE